MNVEKILIILGIVMVIAAAIGIAWYAGTQFNFSKDDTPGAATPSVYQEPHNYNFTSLMPTPDISGTEYPTFSIPAADNRDINNNIIESFFETVTGKY